MRTEVMALVIRDKRDNHVVRVCPVGEMYDEVSLEFTSDLVTPSEIKEYIESYMGFNHSKAIDASKKLAESGIWTDQQEAKDFSSVGNMVINIETKSINWE